MALVDLRLPSGVKTCVGRGPVGRWLLDDLLGRYQGDRRFMSISEQYPQPQGSR